MAIQKASKTLQNNSDTLRPASTGSFDDLAVSKTIVGISDMKVSCDPKISVITHSLGSCVAVVMCDTFSQVGGLLHFQLPKLLEDRVGRPHNPFMFPDTGIPLLAEEIFACGALKHRLTVKLFGGASIMDGKGLFNIGKRNYNAAKRILWRLGYFVKAEDVGGESWRTVELDVGTGMVTVKNSTSEYRI